MKILFVESDYDQRMVGSKILTHVSGYEVEIAENGQEALATLKSFSPDVLITGNRMPRMGGPELIRVIREPYPGIRTILTGGAEDIKQLAEECGADAVFQKPFDWAEMVAMAQELKRRKDK